MSALALIHTEVLRVPCRGGPASRLENRRDAALAGRHWPKKLQWLIHSLGQLATLALVNTAIVLLSIRRLAIMRAHICPTRHENEHAFSIY